MRLVRVPRYMSLRRLIGLVSAARLDRVILNVPRGARAFREATDLDLLALYVRERHLQIILVTPDHDLRQRAAEAGLGVSASLPEEYLAEEAAASSEQPALSTLHLPLWLLVVVFFSVFLGAVVVLWPRPSVVVSAARQRLTLRARMRVSPAYRESQIKDGKLPARMLTKTGLIVYNVPASGSRIEGVTPAQGQVTFLNENAEPLVVPEGSILQSANGPRYRTQGAVTVPPAKHGFLLGVKVSTISGQAQAQVTAETPGTQGNLGPGKLTALLGPLGRRLKAINPAALTGGTDRRVPVVNEEDVARACLEAQRQMELQAPEELRALAGEEQILLAESAALKPGRPATSPRVGEVGQNVRVTMPYNAQCLVIPRTTLAKFLEEQARRQVPAHFYVAREEFALQGLIAVPRTTEEMELEVTASYLAYGRLERRRILEALAGRGENEARTAVLALPEVDSVRFDLPPGRRFPRFLGLIRLVLPKQDGR